MFTIKRSALAVAVAALTLTTTACQAEQPPGESGPTEGATGPSEGIPLPEGVEGAGGTVQPEVGSCNNEEGPRACVEAAEQDGENEAGRVLLVVMKDAEGKSTYRTVVSLSNVDDPTQVATGDWEDPIEERCGDFEFDQDQNTWIEVQVDCGGSLQRDKYVWHVEGDTWEVTPYEEYVSES